MCVYRSVLVLLCIFVLFFISVGAQDRKAEADRLFADAEKLRSSSKVDDRRAAIAKYESAIIIYRELGIPSQEAAATNNIGFVYSRLGEYPKAVEFLEKAIQIAGDAGETKTQILSILTLARTLRIMGRRDEAFARANQALQLSRDIGDREREGYSRNDIAIAYVSDGEVRTGLEHLQAAAAIFEELGSKSFLASAQNNIARINRILGNNEIALEQYARSLAYFREAKHRDGEADLSMNVGAAYLDLFRIAEALENFNRALEIAVETGDKQREGLALTNLGGLHSRIGEYEQAISYFSRGAAVAEKIGAVRLYSSALKNIGDLYINLGEFDKAYDYLNSALESTRQQKNRIDEAGVLSSLASVYARRGEAGKARDLVQQSNVINAETANREGELKSTFILGDIQLQQGDFGSAAPTFEHGLGVSRNLKTPISEIRALVGLSKARRGLGDLAAAKASVENAFLLLESLRNRIPGQEYRSSFFADTREVFELYIDILLGGGTATQDERSVVRALEVSESARARSLLDSLIESRTEVRGGVDAGLLERERSLSLQLNHKENYRIALLGGKPKKEQVEQLEAEIHDLVNEYQQVRARIRIASPHYASIVYPQPLSVAKIRSEILDRDTVMLEFFLGERRGYAWLVSQNTVRVLPLPERREIESLVRDFRSSLEVRNTGSGVSAAERQRLIASADIKLNESSVNLSEILLKPFKTELAGKRIVIVADGVLQYVPFGALPVIGDRPAGAPSKSGKNRYLIETNEVIYAPSASTIALLRAKVKTRQARPERYVSVVADPVFTEDDVRLAARTAIARIDKAEPKSIPTRLRSNFARLRFSRNEAMSIAGLVPNDRELIALDFDANLRTATSEQFRNSRIIHFASHGLVNSEYPELSGIVLSLFADNGQRQDGFLRLLDIYNLELNTDLVVLSACETALGKEIRGEGIVGLTRGFMYAGAPTVVASLWRVEDRATADLMKRLYQRILREQLSPSAALRAAQMAMLREKTTEHPFYWAGFTLQGEWRSAR